MLLAAGHGNRLRPLTVARAKPTMPLLGRPLILHTLEQIRDAGVDEVLVNLHHLPQTVRAVVEAGKPRELSVRYSEEEQILGTAGGLKNVQSAFAGEEDFLLVNGDCYYGFPFAPIIEKHREMRPLATMALRPMPPAATFGPVELDGEGCIVRIAGRPKVPARKPSQVRMFVGVHVLSAEIWRYLEATGNYDINADVYPVALGRRERILGVDTPPPWHDIGTPQRYLRASLDLVADLPPESRATFPGVEITGACHAGAGAHAEPGASFEGGVILADDVLVERGVRIVDSIVLEGARIGAGATIERSIIGEGAKVPPGTTLSDSVLFAYRGNEELLRRREVVGDNVVCSFECYERL